MNRTRWMIIIGGVVIFLVMVGMLVGGHKKKKDISVKPPETSVQSQQGIDWDKEIQEVKQKISNGDYVSAKRLTEDLLDKAPNQEVIQKLNELLQQINFQILINPIPVEGKTVEYEVKPGDTLYGIAKKFGTTVDFIKLRNHLKSNIIKPGQRLSIYTGKFSIVVDKSQNLLMLYADGELVKTYKVSTGKNNSTPEGEFKIVTKLKNPTFFHDGKAIPPGDPKNILGSRWLGFDYGNGSYGIHGTTSPESIGTYETNGCVRMKNEDVEELYALVPVGTPVKVVR